jgi:amino acid adenylation domain-containing protein
MKNVDDVYPLSPMQQGMLFHTLLAPRSGVYFQQFHCTLTGDLSLPEFQQSWQRLVDRHAVLRTAFLWEGLDEPLQAVRTRVELPWDQWDWRDLASGEQRRRFEELLADDRHSGFLLTRAPLMRFALIRVADREWKLVWSFHHLLFDGWSMPVLLREVMLGYESSLRGIDVAFEHRRPYRDYIAWLQAQDMPRAESFWREQLRGFTAPTALALERASGRPSSEEADYGRLRIHLRSSVTQALQRLARDQRLSLNTLVQAAWGLLLRHYSGDEDVVFGATSSGRPASLPGVESMVGLFINTLPVRVRVVPDAPLESWIQQLQAQQMEAREYEYCPLLSIQRWSEVPGSAPLFETILVFENYPADVAGPTPPGIMPRVAISDVGIWSRTNYPLTALAGLAQDELSIGILFDRREFPDDGIRRLLRHLETLLEQIAVGTHRRVAELSPLTDEEREQVLRRWNSTRAVYPDGSRVHDLFEREAHRAPDAIAVVFGNDHLSYRELNDSADRLANRLRSEGVGPDLPVALCLDRSLEMMTGILGVLKAGGAYLPLDPNHPPARRAFQLEDANATVLLTVREMVARVDPGSIRIVCLDEKSPGSDRRGAEVWAAAAPPARANGSPPGWPDSLAYILYTSGSTGRPKGVAMPHRGLVNLLHWHREQPPESPPYGTLQFAPFTFDVSFQELFFTWYTGGTVVLIPEASRRDPSLTWDLIGEHAAQRLFVPFIALQGLSEAARDRPPPIAPLREIVTAGEQLQMTSAVKNLLGAQSGCRLQNQYGPTESHVVTAFELPGSREDLPLLPPIGRPIANTQIYVLDRLLNPVGIGVSGHLHVGGISLARGYQNRPEWTAERFIPDPYGDRPGSRLYRTGDSARWQADGHLQFLGRIDHQAKVRGYRIEPGEVEALLAAHPEVRQAVVLVHKDDGAVAGTSLIAYLVARSNGEREETNTGDLTSRLREHLRSWLPDYMVPGRFVVLDSLPWTSSGKIDRRALPAPERARPELERAYVPPESSLERSLARIWSEVLRVEPVGLQDDFFELGGHSLLATQIVSRVRSELRADLPLRLIFEHPTIGALARAMEESAQGLQFVPIEPAPRDRRLPLSFAQQRLWFLDQLVPGHAFYNLPAAVRLRGALSVDALRSTFQEIVRRHESLRTTFAVFDGVGYQTIAPAPRVKVPLADLADLDAIRRESELMRLSAAEAARPFDLSTGPLLRLTLLRLSREEHAVLLTMHHIVADGWSMGVLVRELTALYASFSRGAPSPLEELPIQYADFAHWQREWLKGERMDRELGYWTNQLAGLPTLQMPTDRPRPPVPSFRGNRTTFRWSQELTRSLRALSRRESCTLFMALMAGFQSVLRTYSRQDDIVVGTDAANRNRKETEGLIGFFVNELVIRTDLGGNPAFRQLLRRVRETTLAAFAHQDMPFEKLVEALNPRRDRSRMPLFQVKLVLQNVPLPTIQVPGGFTLEPLPMEVPIAKYDLAVSIIEDPGGMRGSAEYNTDLFEPPSIARLLVHLERLLASAAADPDRRLDELSLLSDSERRQILAEWNATEAEYPADESLSSLIERQAGRTPDAIAVDFEAGQVSYGELNARANRLAHHLRALGVQPEARVGICMERSPDLIVGLLAVLKSDGVYVPLDPSLPAERMALLIDDAQVPLLLTHETLLDRVPGAYGLLPVCLDRDRTAIASHPASNPPSEATADNLAYVIYTSGSTGRAKGVSISHRAVCRLLFRTNYIVISEDDRLAQASTAAFDAATFEVWGALTHGARLVGVLEPVLLSPQSMSAWLGREAISVLFVTTALFNQLERHAPSLFRSVRCVLFGGEAVQPQWVRQVLRSGAPLRLLHVYGPTETTTFATWFPVEQVGDDAISIPIGRPISNTRVYLLDGDMQLVPPGIPGELCIGGPGLARSYLDRPEATAEAFIPHFPGHYPGERLYRTGDLCRWREDGAIDFLGRLDHQVKLRGFRIELGEVEAALREHPLVRDVAALLRADRAGESRLVAYVVLAPQAQTTDAPVVRIRQAIQERLPEYMVPALFVSLPALPMTSSGKLDRQALPAPDGQSMDYGVPHVPAQTSVERELVGLWSELLGADRVGIHDNFFEMGGHSLVAIQLVSRLRERFQIELELARLFEGPTIAELARWIETAREGAPAPPITPVERSSPLPLSFAQERLWFLDQLMPSGAAYNIPAAVRLKGRLDVRALTATLNEIVRRHETLRTTFASVEGKPIQLIAGSQLVRLPWLELGGLTETHREQEARRLARAEAQLPFDLAAGPLWRIQLLRFADEDHAVLMTMHHIISDAWSLGVLLRELGTIYWSYCHGKESPLPDLPLQYADFAAWQRGWLSGPVLEREVAFWKQRLLGVPTLVLPTDRPRPALRTYRGALTSAPVSEEACAALFALTQQENCTLFMVLLAAFGLLLSRLSGQTDLAIGTPIAGRNRREIEGMIGFFVNTLAVRVELSGVRSFRELLDQVRRASIEAFDHQELPFEKLVEALQPERNLSQTPIFQAFFNMLHMGEGRLELPGLEVESLLSPEVEAKFDLTLYAREQSGRISLRFHYNADLFDGERMEEMLEQLQTLLARVSSAPDAPLDTITLWTERAQKFLPDPTEPLPVGGEQPLLDRMAISAERCPDRIAVAGTESFWTYRQLALRSNELANHLVAAGIGPEDVVALYAPRCGELAIALLGILKAGAAWLILDPAYPVSRTIQLLRTASPRAWVSLKRDDFLPARLVEELDALGCHRLDLSTGAMVSGKDPLSRGSTAAPPLRSGVDDLAYLAFTSGTTGEPKAIAGTCRPIVHFLDWHCRTFGLEETDRFSMLSGLSHDPLVRDIFTPLWLGATLFVPDGRDETLDRWANWMGRTEITVAHLTPALGRVLTGSRSPENGDRRFGSLRHVFFGGDPLGDRDLSAMRRAAPDASVVSFYGATETPQAMGYCRLSADGREGEPARLSLGVGIEGVQLLVLNPASRLCGVGELGSIHVRTPYLSRGYRNDEALTAERFLKSPFTDVAADRIYRTGDLGRYLPDGEVQFAGRSDHQAKIRGFRVELGETRAALVAIRGVRDAAVVCHREGDGEPAMVAYVVPEDAAALTTESLRDHLLETLPDYMVPTAWVMLESLPLTPAGKVDCRALPKPGARPAFQVAYVPPRTPVEDGLAGIWSSLLNIERPGIRDDFFASGGHSLLATQLISRVRRAFQVELSLRDVFERRTIAALADRIEAAAREVQVPPIRPQNRTGPVPLSFAQRRLWFLDQLLPGNAFYNLSTAVRVDGPLNPAALEAAFHHVLRRHEALRTRFLVIDGEPCQLIDPFLPLSIPVVDLNGVDAQLRAAEIRRRAAEWRSRPFDLARGPLLRILLLRLSRDQHAVVFSIHHIVADGWSLGLLLREVAALYASVSLTGGSPREQALPPLPVQYADYTIWQRDLLNGDLLERQISYWRGKLSELPVLQIPTDRPRPSVQSFRGETLSVRLPDELASRLDALSQRAGSTLFMTLLAAFQLLLGRYSGQEDIVVGVPVAGRTQPELEGLIGFFVNSLVLRTDLSGDPTFGELLQRVRETALDAFAHQDLPYERLVETMHPHRALGREPLFQVMFALQNAPIPAFELPGGVSLCPIENDSHTTRFDLTLFVWQGPGTLRCTVEYCTDLFQLETIRRMLAHFEQLLAEVAADSGRRLSALSLLTLDERQRMLTEWQGRRADLAAELTLPVLFDEQAALTPDAVALLFQEQQLSYGTLRREADRLSSLLRRLGVGPETRVGTFLERSPDTVIAMLGVLKAGGVYLPLDPTYPVERVGFMLEDASVSFVLSRQRLVRRLPPHRAQLVLLDGKQEPDGREERGELDRRIRPDNLAYVIYTSGTTGRPKGTMLAHRGVANLVRFQRQGLLQGGDERVLQFAALSYDASVWEMLMALGSGATLCLAESDRLLPGSPLVECLREQGITTVLLPPSVLSSLPMEPLPGLRTLIVGGERCTADLVARWSADRRFFNAYGPTESTIVASTERCNSGSADPFIGDPIDNLRMHVLDRHLNLLPVGIPGQLAIAGIALARGYLGRPGLTAERFVPDPFAERPGDRLYLSGDLARRFSGGGLSFLGRIDHQIKLRGFRIELGEIESVLEEHPRVRQAMVLLREDVPGEKRLVAYVAGAESGESSPWSPAELRSHLQAKLPGHMVPAAFVTMEAWPLSASGKIDRGRLPSPERTRSGERSYVPPVTPIQKELAAIWSDVLRIDRIGIHDNFFELGGHSLLAAQLASRIREKLCVELALIHFFERGTIAELSAAIESPRPLESRLPPIGRVARDAPLPLSFAQQRLWLLDQLQPGSSAYNLFAGVRISGRLDRESLRQAFEDVIRRHEVLRTTFAMAGGRPVQVIAPASRLGMPVTDLSGLPRELAEREMARLAGLEMEQLFDLARGPLLRLRVLRLDREEHAVLLTMHHIVADGWSLGVMLREVAARFAARAAGVPAPLPELPVQYADYASWQRQLWESGALDEQMAYWRRQLTDLPVLQFPPEVMASGEPTFRGAASSFTVPPEITAALRELGRREGCTSFMWMLASLQALLYHYTGQDEIAVGAAFTNRSRTELEPLIGFFVNSLVLRTDLSGDPSFRALLSRVRKVCLEGFAHQDAPFDQLVEELQPERRSSEQPLFQVMFVHQHASTEEVAIPGGLVFRPISVRQRSVRFRLEIHVSETPERLSASLVYDAALFSEAAIDRMARRFQTLLQQVGRNPDTCLDDLQLDTEIRLPGLPLVTTGERARESGDSISPMTAPGAGPLRDHR